MFNVAKTHARDDQLPAIPDVIDGEVVPKPGHRLVVLRAVQHPATRAAGKHAVAHGAYIPLGLAEIGRRWWAGHTQSTYGRFISQARAIGDSESALMWDRQRLQFLKERAERRHKRTESTIAVVRALPYIGAGGAGAELALGILLAIAEHKWSMIGFPVEWTARLCEWAVIGVSAAAVPVAIGAPVVLLIAAWHIGRRKTMAGGPGWLRTSAPDDDVMIDEATVTRALQALRIPQIRDYLKAGHPLQYVTPCRQVGHGTHAVIRLPAGVPAEVITRRRAQLASGLSRAVREVWPAVGAEAALLDLWIADKGALDAGAGLYPLLTEGFTNVFKGVPLGRTLKGDPVNAPIMEMNTIIGGQPGQGKSSASRAILCGVALDPTAEIRVYVPDINFDFEHFRPRCSRYEMGADDETIERIRDDLRDLEAEVQHRGEKLVKYEVPSVTRELASAGVGLHPIVVLLEEAHVAFAHDEYGEDISKSFISIVKLGRKRGIHLIPSTQSPTATSIPKDVTRNCAVGLAFAVSDHVPNDAILGAGAYRAGHRATELIPGVDKGTCIAKGLDGERSQAVQVYYTDPARDNDQVSPIIERSLKEIDRRGKAVPGTGTRQAIEQRDLLADLDAVLGEDRVRLADLPALLRDLAPAWPAYRDMSGVDLRALLDDAGVPTTNGRNVPRLNPADMRRVLAEREPDQD